MCALATCSCGRIVRVGEGDTEAVCLRCGEAVRIAPSPGAAGAEVERHRLANGYTQFTVHLHMGLDRFPSPSACAACGSPFNPLLVGSPMAGASHEFHTGGRHGDHVFELAVSGRLCRACAAHGFPVTDFLRLGVAHGDRSKLVVQVGDRAAADCWRAQLEKYDREWKAAHERDTHGMIKMAMPAFTEERFTPGGSGWTPPLGEAVPSVTGAGGGGCLVLVASGALLAAGGILAALVAAVAPT